MGNRSSLVVVVLLLAACTAQALVPSPTATPSPLAPGPFTQESLQARVDKWPAAYKLILSNDIAVLFTDMPDSVAMWESPAFIYHIPSTSRIELYGHGYSDASRGTTVCYGTSETGRLALEEVLADPDVMARINARIPDYARGPAPQCSEWRTP